MSDTEFSWYAVPQADYMSATGWATREEAETHKNAIEMANPCSVRVVRGAEFEEGSDQ